MDAQTLNSRKKIDSIFNKIVLASIINKCVQLQGIPKSSVRKSEYKAKITWACANIEFLFELNTRGEI